MAANEKRDQILLWYLDVICRIILLISNKLHWLYTRMKWHQNLDLCLSNEISLLHFCEFAFYFEACKLCSTSCKAEQSSLDSKCCWSCYRNRKSLAPCLLLKKGMQGYSHDDFQLGLAQQGWSLESVNIPLLYNSRYLQFFYVFYCCSFWAAEVSQSYFKCYWFKYLSVYFKIGKDEGKQKDHLFNPQRPNWDMG